MNNKIALKILPNSSLSKCVEIVRRFEELPISTISTCIKEQKFIFEYDTTDYDGLDNIIECYRELSAINIPVEVFEFGLQVSIDILENRQQRVKDSFDWFDEDEVE